ncbi:MAG: FCSD flavin-binding domain-containing protein [Paracoccaceae bacterium]
MARVTWTRRRALAAAAAALAAPHVRAAGAGQPKVVVVGGGAGGATAARYLVQGGGLDVTLVEPTRAYYSCFFSNLHIGGLRSMASLAHDYGRIAAEGVEVIHDTAIAIDRDRREVGLAGGVVLPYDRLVLSPGVDFVEGAVPGWDITQAGRMPHAYKSAGDQTELLKAQIEAMPEGGLYCMIAPPNPYRCPPAPYERISMVAHRLKQINPTAKILIADPKDHYSKQALFEEAWDKYYGGMITRLGPDFGGDVVSVDPGAMEVDIDGEVNRVDVCNVIPAMKAGWICDRAGLTEGDWAPVMPVTMQSRIDESIHVLGDAADQGDMPKAAFAATGQAKAAAMAVRAALLGARAFPPRYANACWSFLAPDDVVKLADTFRAGEEKIERVDRVISQMNEDPALRRRNAEEAVAWYDAITADIFG